MRVKRVGGQDGASSCSDGIFAERIKGVGGQDGVSSRSDGVFAALA